MQEGEDLQCMQMRALLSVSGRSFTSNPGFTLQQEIKG